MEKRRSLTALSDMPEVPVASKWQSQSLKNPGLCFGPRALCYDVLHETMNDWMLGGADGDHKASTVQFVMLMFPSRYKPRS